MRTLLAMSISLFCLAPSIGAQDLAEACATLSRIDVGQWAEYQIKSQNAQESGQARFSIVGTEDVEGQEYYWYEMKMSAAMGTMVMQMLVPSYPYEPSEIRSAVMKMGDQPAMKMPDQMLAMMQSQGTSDPAKEFARECGSAELVGHETITVPAGTFDVLHLRANGREAGEIWVSVDIPFGLVKITSDGGEEILLSGHGSDATSSIANRPR